MNSSGGFYLIKYVLQVLEIHNYNTLLLHTVHISFITTHYFLYPL